MRKLRVVGAVALVAGLLGAAPVPVTDTMQALLDAPQVVPASPAAVAARCDTVLATVVAAQRALEAAQDSATVANSFAPYDRLSQLASVGFSEAYLVAQSNPDKAIRAAAEKCVQRMSDFFTALALSRPVYARLAAIPTRGLDAETAWVLKRALLQYRLAGVDRDAATRVKVADLQKRITATSLVFDGNARDAPYALTLAAGDLSGMPADFIAAHPVDAAGKIKVTGESDTYALLVFADKESTRRAAWLARTTRAWPENGPVLRELLTERAELAHTLGYPNYAAVNLADKMIETPQRAQAFLDQVNAAATPGADRDYGELLARWRRIAPGATQVDRWNGDYVARLLRKERYDVDDAVVRSYFSYNKVRTGIFRLTHDLFGADIRPWRTPVWHPSVTAWEVYDGQRLVGRFYLDPHPREGKYGYFSQFPIRAGATGRAVPIAALILNFPASGGMDHSDVSTFLHELGHLLHTLYSGHHRWAASTMDGLERDFIEAPSQLLEEWTWDYATLATFASDAEGRTISRDLVARMNRARTFQEGIQAKGQIFLSAVSLDFYTVPPAQLDFDAGIKRAQQRYSVYPYEPRGHFWAGFDHLTNYTAGYYTYVWSKAIALDLFTRFQRNGLRDRATALAYRQRVLEPGASVPAAALITGFLHRPLDLAAYRARVSGGGGPTRDRGAVSPPARPPRDAAPAPRRRSGRGGLRPSGA